VGFFYAVADFLVKAPAYLLKAPAYLFKIWHKCKKYVERGGFMLPLSTSVMSNLSGVRL
jgi:hypothetical protein